MIYFQFLFTTIESAKRDTFLTEFENLCVELHAPAGLVLLLDRRPILGQETYFIQTPLEFIKLLREFSSRFSGIESTNLPWPGDISLITGKF